jgi:hypothetical protein
MKKRKRERTLPRGWTQERVRRLAKHYDNQSANEQVAEHEAAFRARNCTVMVVPTKLVPEIRDLIARRRRRPAS